jgi:hypothetical protein
MMDVLLTLRIAYVMAATMEDYITYLQRVMSRRADERAALKPPPLPAHYQLRDFDGRVVSEMRVPPHARGRRR